MWSPIFYVGNSIDSYTDSCWDEWEGGWVAGVENSIIFAYNLEPVGKRIVNEISLLKIVLNFPIQQHFQLDDDSISK